MRLRLFKESNSICKGGLWTWFVGAEGEVCNNECSLAAANNGASQGNEFIHGDRDGVLFPEKIIAGAIADEENWDTSLIEDRGGHLFVRSEHRPLLALSFPGSKI